MVEDVGADDPVVVEVLAGGLLAGGVVAGVTALVDPALVVDEEVVADVVPAVALDVVGVDRPHRGRRVGVGPVRRRHRVVDEQLRDRRVLPVVLADRLVGAPLGPGDDGRLGHRRLGPYRSWWWSTMTRTPWWWSSCEELDERNGARSAFVPAFLTFAGRRVLGGRWALGGRRRRCRGQAAGAGAVHGVDGQDLDVAGIAGRPNLGGGGAVGPDQLRQDGAALLRSRGRGRRTAPAKAPSSRRRRRGGCRRRPLRCRSIAPRDGRAGTGCRPPPRAREEPPARRRRRPPGRRPSPAPPRRRIGSSACPAAIRIGARTAKAATPATALTRTALRRERERAAGNIRRSLSRHGGGASDSWGTTLRAGGRNGVTARPGPTH